MDNYIKCDFETLNAKWIECLFGMNLLDRKNINDSHMMWIVLDRN